MAAMFIGPGTPGGDALSLNGAFSAETAPGALGTTVFNTREVHAAEIPAANGITNARSLARIYAATLAPVDGVQLLSDATRDVARRTLTPAGEGDVCLIMNTTFGMGFMTHGEFTPYSGPGSYGHFGAGGSVAYAQPERDLAFGYVMNRMANGLAGDLRAQSLIDAAAACADAAG
jgi:CubicO group peptidase (beta-lactamase class C family)